jgi:uncharacterized Zn finger protein (UPF0148 family)
MKRNYIVNTRCKKCGSPKQELLVRGARNECPFCQQKRASLVQEPEPPVQPPVKVEEEEKTVSIKAPVAFKDRPIWDPKMSKTRLLEILAETGYSEDTESLSKKEIIRILESV